MKLEQIERIILRNLHEPVKIYWVNPDYDWHNWVIRGYDLRNQVVELIGFDDSYTEYLDKDKPEFAQFNEIRSIKAMKIANFQYTSYVKDDQIIIGLMKRIGYENI